MPSQTHEQLIQLMKNDTYRSRVVVGDTSISKTETGKGCLTFPFLMAYLSAVISIRWVRREGEWMLRATKRKIKHEYDHF